VLGYVVPPPPDLGQSGVMSRSTYVRRGYDGSGFAGFRFPPEVITVAIRWYLRYGVSYRDVEGLLMRATPNSFSGLSLLHRLRRGVLLD
jgi:hypothetical protein